MATQEDKDCPSKVPCNHPSEALHVHVVCEECIKGMNLQVSAMKEAILSFRTGYTEGRACFCRHYVGVSHEPICDTLAKAIGDLK